MDRISEANMAAVLARIECEAISPPDDLTGPARVLFTDIASGNKSRPWNAAHAHALAHYCRVTVMWEEQLGKLATEGAVLDTGKENRRLKALGMLSGERMRLAGLLGLHIGTKDRLLGGQGKAEERLREMGSALRESAEGEAGHLLA